MVSRRAFLLGCSSIVAAATFPCVAPSVTNNIPVIIGDGSVDCWPGLKALLAGNPVRIVDDCVSFDGHTLSFGPGTFTLSSFAFPSGVVLRGVR